MRRQSGDKRRRDPRDLPELFHVAKWPGAIAKCHDGHCPAHPDPVEALEIGDPRGVEVQPGVLHTRQRFGPNPGKREVRGKPPQGGRPDSDDSVEPGDTAERTEALAIRHDPPRQRRPDSWEPLQLAGAGTVGVDPFPWVERPGQCA